MACWKENFWTELLASLPEMVRMSSLLPTEKAGDEVRERGEWRVSIPLDWEGERARPHWAGGFTPEWGHSPAPHPGPSCPLQSQTQRCCCLKPCWLPVAMLPARASLHWTQWLTWLPGEFIPWGWNRQENEMERADLPFALLLHCNHIFHNRNIPEKKRKWELNVWTGWQAEHAAMSQRCQQHPSGARLVDEGNVCLSPYMRKVRLTGAQVESYSHFVLPKMLLSASGLLSTFPPHSHEVTGKQLSNQLLLLLSCPSETNYDEKKQNICYQWIFHQRTGDPPAAPSGHYPDALRDSTSPETAFSTDAGHLCLYTCRLHSLLGYQYFWEMKKKCT